MTIQQFKSLFEKIRSHSDAMFVKGSLFINSNAAISKKWNRNGGTYFDKSFHRLKVFTLIQRKKGATKLIWS